MTQENTSNTDDMAMEDESDLPYFANFAMVREADNIVQDKLICLNTFKMSGYYFVEITDGAICDIGMRYDAVTGTFSFVAPENESSSTGETASS